MARPPSPPQKPLDPQDRQASLSRYAHHLSSLSRQLDTRAQTISASQSRLATANANLQAQYASLHQLEANIRAEMTSFLHQIHTRQLALSQWEAKSRRTRHWLSDRVASVKMLLQDANSVRVDLEAKRAKITEIENKLVDSNSQLTNVQAQLEQLSKNHRELRKDAIRITDEKDKLKRAANRLESLDHSLRARQTDLDNRQAQVESSEQQVARFRQLEGIVSPLQSFLDHHANIMGHPAIRVTDDTVAAVHAAVSSLNDMRNEAEKIEEQRRKLKKMDREFSEREKSIKRTEAALRSRDLIVQREQKRLDLEQREVSSARRDLELGWKNIEGARTESEIREEALRTKEATFAHTDLCLQRREVALSEHEKTLVRREKSVRRAHTSVLARERTLQAHGLELEAERARLQSSRKAVDLKEGMMESRDLELSARESEQGSRLETLLKRTLERDRVSGNTSRQVLRSVNIQSQADDAQAPLEKLDLHESPRQENVGPETVRRQLAFDTTRKTDPKATGQDEANMEKTGSVCEDDDSEVAAEQLLPELLGVRSYWKERVERLERLVESMVEKSWAVKPHVQQVLESVTEGLRNIKEEIDTLAKPKGNSPKEAYMSEQTTQIRWRDRMKEHFNSVCEVQAGLLISLNREDDVVPQQMSPPEQTRNQNIVRSPIEDESSVEATLDATATGEFTNFHLDGEKTRAGKSPFQRFREEMRSKTDENSETNSDRGKSGSSSGQGTKHQLVVRSEDVTRELSSVRGELENIGGLGIFRNTQSISE